MTVPALSPASAAHAEALAHLHAAAFPPRERWGRDAFALQLGLPGVYGYVSERGGMVLARVVADEAEILTLAVHPSARRQGLARLLLAEAMRHAAGRDAARMFLEVSEANAAARALYERAGFAEIGRRPAYYQDGADALVLAITIVSESAAR